MIKRLRDSLRVLFGRKQFEQDMDDELRFHIERQVEDLVKQGIPRLEAVRRAGAGFGAVQGIKEDARRARGVRWADELRADLRYAFRTLRLSPGYAAIVVLTLGLGIGANTTIFSVINGVLLKPLPFPESERLVQINRGYPTGALAVYHRDATTFETIGAYQSVNAFNLFTGSLPERIEGRAVSSEFFAVLRVNAALGRTLRPGEDRVEAPAVAVISYGLWRRRFGSDPSVIGRTVGVDGVRREVVGVMPRDFGFPTAATEIWIPIQLDPKNVGDLWGAGGTTFVGRLKLGIALEQADAEHRQLITRVRDAFPWRMPDTYAQGPENHLVRLDEVGADGVRSRLGLLLVAVGLVLLVACVNVANLNLTRLATREREIAVRQALGGSRSRVARQIVVEQLVLSGLGGSLGIVGAFAATPILVGWLPPETPRLDHVAVDGGVLAFTAVAATLAGLLAAIGPVLRVPRGSAESLGIGSRGGSAGPRRGRLVNLLVAAEVALAVVLVVGAGVLLRSLGRLLAVDPGIRVEQLVTARVNPDPIRCGNDLAPCLAFYEKVERAVASLPGVSQVAFASQVPLDGQSEWWPMEVEDHPVKPGGEAHGLSGHVVSPKYFETLGIGLEQGRRLGPEDLPGRDPVVVVGRTLAEKFWPGASPIGKKIKPVWVKTWATIVGVVGDARYDGLSAEPVADFYMPMTQWSPGAMTVVVRSELSAAVLEPALKRALAEVDPAAPMSQVRPMEEIVQRSVASPRTTALLLSGFATLALTLGAVGVYGVLSYGVTQRRREIGIRMAIGADPASVRRMIVSRAARLVVSGVVIGLCIAWLAASLLRGFVFGVGVRDPITYAAVPVLFAVVGILASYLPARRATRVSPTEVMRDE